MFVTRLLPSRRFLRPPELAYVAQVAAVEAPDISAGLDQPFTTRRHRSRRFLPFHAAPELNQYPNPVGQGDGKEPNGPDVPFTTRKIGSRRSLQRLPDHAEYPESPPVQIDPGVIRPDYHIRYRATRGLFLTAADVIEADVVQPVASAVFIGPLLPRGRRRRTKWRLQSPEQVNHVDRAPPAGEEYETAWRAPTLLYRRETKRYLRNLVPYPSPWTQWPAWREFPKLFRKATGYVRREVIQPPHTPLAPPVPEQPETAFRAWLAFYRKVTRFIGKSAALPPDAPPPLPIVETIEDIEEYVGTGSHEHDLSIYFTYADSFSISPSVEAGWSFDTDTGVLTLDTNIEGEFGPYVVTGTNRSGSTASNEFTVAVLPVGALTATDVRITPTMSASIRTESGLTGSISVADALTGKPRARS